MEINKEILLECICHLCKYNFSDIKNYQVCDGFILATVISENDKLEFFIGEKSVDVDFEEYQEFVRRKKLDIIKKSIL